MAALEIIKFPNPLLQRVARPVDFISQEDKFLLDQMLETMYINQGVGLAAPQVGILKRAIVVDIGEGPMQLINPSVIKKIGSELGEEGCLSLPDVTVKIRRAQKITYKGLTKDGRLLEGEADGILARAIQHEIDHLEGRLIINYANPLRRVFLKKRLIKKSRS